MEGLAPPLQCVIELRQSLQNGNSLRVALSQYLNVNQDGFSDSIREYIFLLEQGQSTESLLDSQRSIYRKSVLQVLLMGFKGVAILEPLEELESSIRGAAEQELETYLRLLPFKMMVPVLFLVVPGYILLLFGPIVLKLLEEVTL